MLSEGSEFYIAMVYGVSYFVLSAVVFSYPRKGARCDLVESFSLFGWFALLHGVADTAGILTTGPWSIAGAAGPISAIRIVFEFFSWAVLLKFSMNILIRDDQARADLIKYAYLVYAVSITFVVIDLLLTGPKQAIVYISIVFGSPISLIAGAAFFMLARGTGTARIKRLHLLFNGIAFCFALYALLRVAPIFWDTDAGLAVVRILRVAASLALAAFTAVALSSLRPAKKASEEAPAYSLN